MANHAAIAVPAAKKRANPKMLSIAGRIRICAEIPRTSPPATNPARRRNCAWSELPMVLSAVTMQVRTDGADAGPVERVVEYVTNGSSQASGKGEA